MKKLFWILTVLLVSVSAYAQIGYQVALLNNATGEPRANETVGVQISITNSKGGVLYSGSQSATTNDFGIISLTVGKETTFNSLSSDQLPLFISATVDGILIGKSQVLSVPVAEYAKNTGTLTKKILMSKVWKSVQTENGDPQYYLKFGNTTVTTNNYYGDEFSGTYFISGDCIGMCVANGDTPTVGMYIPSENCIVAGYRVYK